MTSQKEKKTSYGEWWESLFSPLVLREWGPAIFTNPLSLFPYLVVLALTRLIATIVLIVAVAIYDGCRIAYKDIW